MTTVHDRWRQGLEAEARLVELELPNDATGPEAVMRRGHRRHRRNQLLASVTCLGLVAGSAAAWSVSRGDGPRANELRIADEPEGGVEPAPVPTTTPAGAWQVDPATLPPVDLVPTTFRWATRVVPFGEGVGPSYFGPATASPSGLVNVSTRPGVRRPGDGDEGRALYTSDDGVTWTGTTLDESHWFGGVTRSPRGLVAVGTAAATAPILKTSEYGGLGDVVVSTSDDGGATWNDLVLPIDLRAAHERARAAGTPIQLGVSSAKVVERDGVTTVAVGISGMPLVDLGSLVPGGIDLEQGYALLADGVLVLGPGGRLYTWAELGIDAEVAQWLGERTVLLRSTDGTTFTPRGEALRGYLYDLVPVLDRVAVVLGGLTDTVDSPAGITVVELDAGDRRQVLPSLPFDGGYLAAGELSGILAVAGTARGWPALARWDGAAWRTTVLANGVFREGTTMGFGLAAVGAGGVAFAVDVYDDPSYGLAVGDGGFTLRSDGSQRGFSVVEDATGEVLGTLGSLEPGAVPTGGRLRAVTDTAVMAVAVPTTAVGRTGAAADATTTVVGPVGAGDGTAVPTTNVVPVEGEYTQLVAVEVLDGAGAVVARLDVTALVRAMEEAWATPVGSEPPGHESLLLHSADGAAWSSLDLGEAAGTGITQVTGVLSTADGLVVTASTNEADPDAPAPAEGAPGPIRRQVALVGTPA